MSWWEALVNELTQSVRRDPFGAAPCSRLRRSRVEAFEPSSPRRSAIAACRWLVSRCARSKRYLAVPHSGSDPLAPAGCGSSSCKPSALRASCSERARKVRGVISSV